MRSQQAGACSQLVRPDTLSHTEVMKLALIRRQFSATGGAELYLQRLMTALAGAGHEVHLFAEAWSGQAREVKLHAVPVTGNRATRPVRFAEAVKELTSWEKFDCVFSLERTLQQDVYRAGDGVHRVWLERRRQFAPWWKRPFIGLGAFHRNMLALEARTFDPANTGRIIVNSNMVKGEIRRHFPFPEDRIHLVRNGVEVKRFQSGKRAETRARFGVKDDEFLLLFVGSGWERKGLRFILKPMLLLEHMSRTGRLDALAAGLGTKLPARPVKLLVVGKDKPIPGTPPQVIFAGSMNQVEDAYAAADLFVFPPVYEPSANVVFEALAAGIPVITSTFNGSSELISEGVNGTIIQDPRDFSAFLKVIWQWTHREHSLSLAETTHLSIQRNVSETVTLLEQVAEERRT